MPSESAIMVSELTKCYGELLAVDQINFAVKKGEVFGFLGPNGAGKTTTINMLTGVTKPTSGSAFISGFNVKQEPTKAKELVGVVPETSFLYDEMTAWNNINFSAKLHSVPKKKRASLAQELLRLFRLHERRNDRVGTFSGGMKKRLMIATALIHEPEILFLDEPTTGLDVQSARQIRELIKELNEKGTTVFLTTHYIEEADQLCQRIAIINRGKIITVDTPEELKNVVKKENIIEVSFDHAGDIVDELKELSRVRDVVIAGDKFRLYVEDPAETLPSLVHFAEKNHLKVTSVSTIKPTLEDAFVKLTGLHPELMTFEKEPTKPS
ncbi:MAG TPA: ATP-binding cassette domain-containing protein [Candidatus Bathyarchaeota archaeon]|nr:ATP-binding cassette domain-containing protein [Candidatus Bathyarchaeota archaeon]